MLRFFRGILKLIILVQFWNVKVVTRKPAITPAADSEDADSAATAVPPWVEEEQKETPTSLKERQIRMEQQVYRIWT